MKKNILLLIFLLCGGVAFSQSKFSVQNLKVERHGEQVKVSFEASTVLHPFNSSNTYTFTPLLYKGDEFRQLAPIALGGRRAEIVNERRGGVKESLLRKGSTVHYDYTLPFERWMQGAMLAVEERVQGCCRTTTYPPILLSDTIFGKKEAVVTPASDFITVPHTPPSVGEQIAEKYSFVVPVSDVSKISNLTDKQRQKAIEHELSHNEDNALKIYFEVAKSVIDPAFGSNADALKALSEAINAIVNSSDSRVTHIVIAGFASPEGTFKFNERLAWNRALSLKEFLTKNTSVDSSYIHLYNGSENWIGLRKLVAEGSMHGKEEVLYIIDNIPLSQNREKQLMELAGGVPYRYMAKQYFPRLRHAAHIRVYYTETEQIKSNKNQ